MTTMATPATNLISEEEYLRTSYEPDAEFVDGAIEERSPGNNDHAKWQVALAYFFSIRAVAWNVLVRTELRNRVADRRWRIPDAALYDAAIPEESVPTHPPLTIFEIVSPDDRHQQLMTRLADFEGMGVEAIFLIYPETGLFKQFRAGQLFSVEAVTCKSYTVPVEEIRSILR